MTEQTAAPLDYDAAYELTQRGLESALLSSPQVIRLYMRHLSGAKGKQIRAKSLLCCAMDQENGITPDAVTFGIATELLHLATLVHDDIIDNADIRRGIPTLNNKFGQRAAVICGDYLFSRALSIAASIPDKQKYLQYDMPDYISQICYGELRELLHNADADTNELEYLKVISGKTAALFEASYYAGALLSGCDQQEAKRYKHMGWYAGMIFQLMDDCNDFESTQKTIKKAVKTDYEQGVFTLPILHVMHKSPECKKMVQRGKLKRSELDHIVREQGGLDYSHALARRFRDKLQAVMDRLCMSEQKRDRLTAILQSTVQGAR